MRSPPSVPVDKLLAATEAAAHFAHQNPVYRPVYKRLLAEVKNTAIPRRDVERAYKVAARLVDLHGEEFLPYFEVMDREMAELDRKDALMANARRVAREGS